MPMWANERMKRKEMEWARMLEWARDAQRKEKKKAAKTLDEKKRWRFDLRPW